VEKETQADLDQLAGVLARLTQVQQEADTLLIKIALSGNRGAQAAVCRLLGIKRQSLPDRLTAARNRIANATS
jgi:transcriptional regulator with PAS, ATPase and Fis domain